MSAKEMYDYLDAVAADYTTTELTVNPHKTLNEESEMMQDVHEFDDGEIGVITFSSDPVFTVTLQWDYISEVDSGTIFDFWNDSNKGKGRARTFYWTHPRDGHTYTVKFFNILKRSYSVAVGGGRSSISAIQLRVVGVKPT